jgi:hypothetical protein
VRGEGVAAHDVECDELRAPLGHGDAGLAGVACGGDLASVGFEVLGADASTAPDQSSFAHFGGVNSGARSRPGKTAKGNPYLKGVLGDAAAAAGKTKTFLGERYRRLARRRGKLKALVAIARTLLVISWHLLADRAARFDDLGDDYYITTIRTDRQLRTHIRQIESLGYNVTITPVAA